MEGQVLQSGRFPWVVSGFPQLPFTFWKTSYLDFGLWISLPVFLYLFLCFLCLFFLWRSHKLFFPIYFVSFLLSYFFNIQELLCLNIFCLDTFVLKSFSHSCLSALFKKDPKKVIGRSVGGGVENYWMWASCFCDLAELLNYEVPDISIFESFLCR